MYLEKKVEVRELLKKYGKSIVLDGLSFEIYKGEIFGLLGPNGAGKSTFISILTTLTKPTSGDIFIDTFSVSKQPDKVKTGIGFVPQDIALYPMLSGLDNLYFWAGIYNLKGQEKRNRVEEALSVVKLEERAKDRVSEYSGGMKRRLNIAVALLHKPDLLVMDEPTAGVDIQSRRYIFEAVGKLKAEGRTVVFTSHYVDEMKAFCDRIAILDKGRLKAIGSVEELKKEYNVDNLEDILLTLHF
ncbi:MAG: ABC transporter ATP-binding protein [Ruminiclostridium sp.]|nr:ABC transporter ATP-binding protein [Ruminiclostridium sp.]